MKKRLTADYIAKVAVLSALSVVLFAFARFPIFPPPYNFLDLDFSSLPVLLGGFALGPVATILIEIVKVTAKIIIQGPSYGGAGDISNFIISLSFVLPAAIIYKRNHTKKGAFIGLAVGTISQIIVGAISNYFVIVPLVVKLIGASYFMEIRTVFSFGVGSLFNLIKGASNSILAIVFYKRLSPLLKRSYSHYKKPTIEKKSSEKGFGSSLNIEDATILKIDKESILQTEEEKSKQ